MGVQRIHACQNLSILYRYDYAELDKCPNYVIIISYKSIANFYTDKDGSAKVNERKKGGKTGQEDDDSCVGVDTTRCRVPALVMYVVPASIRPPEAFSNPRNAELMTWHDECHMKDYGKLQNLPSRCSTTEKANLEALMRADYLIRSLAGGSHIPSSSHKTILRQGHYDLIVT